MSLYDREQWAKERLMELQNEYQERAKPFIAMLAQISALKPPPPMIIDTSTLPHALLEELKRKAGEHVG